MIDQFRPWHFLGLIGAIFLAASAIGLHGSSIDVFAHYFPRTIETGPLLGTWKGIRVDEWNTHTPSILNQLFRPDTLSTDGSAVGPGASALLLNVPAKFLVMIFRPQFWSFFVLPPELAFSTYWQFKTLLLLGGLFTLLHLITEHAAYSAALALSFYFAAYTQWAFSWPTLLPEQIGSISLAVALLCRSLVSDSRIGIPVMAAIAGVFAANFALSVYPPHQIPLAWVGITVMAWWIVTRRELILHGPFRGVRLVGLAICAAIIVAALLSFYLDARAELMVGADTVYPGQRRTVGGDQSALLYASHFLDFWKTEANTMAKLQNVCEATGYFWFGPLTILFARGIDPGPLRKLHFALLFLFIVFSMWIFVPVPPRFGNLMGLQLVTTARMLPAMGLINILLLACFFSAYRPATLSKWSTLIIGGGALILSESLLLFLNQKFELGLRLRYVALSAIFFTATLLLIRANQRALVALALVLPIAATTALVNPIGRGLPVITKSELHSFLTMRPELMQRKWLVFSSDVVGPNYLSAHGLNVFNSFHAIPDLANLKKLDPQKRFLQVYNSSGYLIANEQSRNDISFERITPGVFRMYLTPNDPALREIGVSALAFRAKPPETLTSGLKPLTDKPVDTFWLYEFSH